MKVIGLAILHRYCVNHTDCADQISTWIAEVEEAAWAKPNDIKARYASASFLPDNRVVFNIKGNRYRLDTKVFYQRKVVMVKRMGTHAEYEGWKF
ncbi:type II toxin-antitoxin system HigB family toxin [Dehalogenimonas sp. 4OHTPN]|uniref:Type II toxin-antitoxin system HigB family toxin n=1 Tax=Dehalogenimonas sp. 4OHTPN TaxID=3166643 RepID=A0AAU8GE63_9CHLR